MDVKNFRIATLLNRDTKFEIDRTILTCLNYQFVRAIHYRQSFRWKFKTYPNYRKASLLKISF